MNIEVMHLKCFLQEVREGRFNLTKTLEDGSATLISVDDVTGTMSCDESSDTLAAVTGIPVSPVLVRRQFDPPEHDTFVITYGNAQLTACMKFESGAQLNLAGSGGDGLKVPEGLETYEGKTINDLPESVRKSFHNCLVVVLPDRVRLERLCV